MSRLPNLKGILPQVMHDAMTDVLGTLMSNYSEEYWRSTWDVEAAERIPAICRGKGDDASLQELEMIIIAEMLGHWANYDPDTETYIPYTPACEITLGKDEFHVE